MGTVEQTKGLVQDLIDSYADQVDGVGMLIDATYQSLEDSKDRRAKLSTELKDALAKKGSLRRKDFDNMMNGILLNQERKEKEVKQSLRNFIKEKKNHARQLSEALSKSDVEKLKKTQIEIEKRVTEIKRLLEGFYGQHKELTDQLKKLLTKGKDLKIRDFKDMIRNLQTRKKRGDKEMGLQDVATDIKAFGQDMVASYTERAAFIEELSKEVKGMIKALHNEHAERKAELNAMLESFRKNLNKEVHRFIKDVNSESEQRKAEIGDMLATFTEDLRKEVENLKEGFHKEGKQRRNEVVAMANAMKATRYAMAGVRRKAKTASTPSQDVMRERKVVRKAKGKSKKA